MNQKELVILGLIFAAFIAIVAIDWRKALGIAGTLEAAPLVPAADPSQEISGPGVYTAAVVNSRIVLPANFGPMMGMNRTAAANDAAPAPAMYSCGGLC